jgi:hypothetical protein
MTATADKIKRLLNAGLLATHQRPSARQLNVGIQSKMLAARPVWSPDLSLWSGCVEPCQRADASLISNDRLASALCSVAICSSSGTIAKPAARAALANESIAMIFTPNALPALPSSRQHTFSIQINCEYLTEQRVTQRLLRIVFSLDRSDQ